MKKHRGSIVLIAVILLAMAGAVTCSAETATSGECGKNGNNVTWILDQDGVLTISGTGEMRDCDSNGPFSKSELIKRVIVEEGVTSIGKYAFYQCPNLEEVILPDGITDIGNYAFCSCVSLHSLDMPDSVYEMGDMAFSGCTALKHIKLSNNLRSIQTAAFENCSSLTSMIIPGRVSFIGLASFISCDKLRTVYIPSSVIRYGGHAFSGCSSDLTVYSTTDLSSDIKNDIIDESVHLITNPSQTGSCGSYAAYALYEDGQLIISGSGKMDDAGSCIIGNASAAVTAISIANGITEIGSKTFFGCTGLTTIDLPLKLNRIGCLAFYGCSGLERVTFTGNAPEIEDLAFGEWNEVRAMFYYPCNNATWLETTMQGYPVNYNNLRRNHDIKKIESVSPTCSAPGNSEYWKCSICHRCFEDSNGFDPSDEENFEIPALKHNWGDVVYEWSEDHSSLTATRTCSKNTETGCTQTETVGSTSEVVEPATCSRKGKTKYTSNAFSNPAFSVQTETAEDIPTLEHNWNDGQITTPATCAQKGEAIFSCRDCGATKTEPVDIDPDAHDWDDGEITTAPGCISEGIRTYTCRNDSSHTRTTAVSAKGHTPAEKVREQMKAATCTQDGSYDEVVYCSVCRAELSRDTIVIQNLGGHKWGAPSYAWAGSNASVTAVRICGNDASHKETETVRTTSKVTKAPTYTSKGQTTYTAAFRNAAFKKQTRVVTNVPMLAKKAQPMTVSVTKKTVKAKKLKKKARTITPIVVRNAQGKVTYKLISGNARSKKALKLNTKTGRITVKKKTGKGTYRIRVMVSASGSTVYKAGSKVVTLTVKVK